MEQLRGFVSTWLGDLVASQSAGVAACRVAAAAAPADLAVRSLLESLTDSQGEILLAGLHPVVVAEFVALWRVRHSTRGAGFATPPLPGLTCVLYLRRRS